MLGSLSTPLNYIALHRAHTALRSNCEHCVAHSRALSRVGAFDCDATVASSVQLSAQRQTSGEGRCIIVVCGVAAQKNCTMTTALGDSSQVVSVSVVAARPRALRRATKPDIFQRQHVERGRRVRPAPRLVVASAGSAPCVMVNGVTGKMGFATAEAAVQRGLRLLPVAFSGASVQTGAELVCRPLLWSSNLTLAHTATRAGQRVSCAGIEVDLRPYDASALQALKERHPVCAHVVDVS